MFDGEACRAPISRKAIPLVNSGYGFGGHPYIAEKPIRQTPNGSDGPVRPTWPIVSGLTVGLCVRMQGAGLTDYTCQSEVRLSWLSEEPAYC